MRYLRASDGNTAMLMFALNLHSQLSARRRLVNAISHSVHWQAISSSQSFDLTMTKVDHPAIRNIIGVAWGLHLVQEQTSARATVVNM